VQNIDYDKQFQKKVPNWFEVVKRNRRIVFGGGCTAVRLSNVGSACKDILNIGFSLSRTPLPQEPTRHPAGNSP